MNIYILSVIENLFKKCAEAFAQLPRIEEDLHEELWSKLRLSHYVYQNFLSAVGFIHPERNYCSATFKDVYDFRERTGINSIDTTLKRLFEMPLTRDAIVPIHTDISDPETYYLLIGIASVNIRSKTITIIADEIFFERKNIRHSAYHLIYLNKVLETYDPDIHSSVRDLASTCNVSYGKFLLDCREYFKESFYSHHLKLRLCLALTDIMFTSIGFERDCAQP